MNFEDIIGHEKIIENFKNAVMNGHIAHSYIFEGPRTIGKRTTAIALSKILLCESKQQESCGICTSCVQFKNDNQPDFKIISTEDSSIKVEEVRALEKDIGIRPFSGNRKIYIICGAEKMTVAAQNSFLKTLEEPPEYAVIILTTENKDALLPTIVSRCQTVVFKPTSSSRIEKFLIDKFDETDEEASFIANFSNGIVGRAVKLSQNEKFKDLRDETIKAIDTTVMESKEKIFTTREFFEKNKEDIVEILDIVLFYFRDVVIYGETESDKHIINKDKMHFIKTHYNQLEKNALHDIIETVLDTKDNIHLKVNFSLNIEMMLLEIQEVISCYKYMY